MPETRTNWTPTERRFIDALAEMIAQEHAAHPEWSDDFKQGFQEGAGLIALRVMDWHLAGTAASSAPTAGRPQ